jgi:hypothetical protein
MQGGLLHLIRKIMWSIANYSTPTLAQSKHPHDCPIAKRHFTQPTIALSVKARKSSTHPINIDNRSIPESRSPIDHHHPRSFHLPRQLQHQPILSWQPHQLHRQRHPIRSARPPIMAPVRLSARSGNTSRIQTPASAPDRPWPDPRNSVAPAHAPNADDDRSDEFAGNRRSSV